MTDYMLPIITGTELTTGDLLRWSGSAWVNYADSAYSGSGHLHDGDTLQLDGINSDGGAFSFTTSGAVTFNQSIATANYGATNKLTACATNAGGLDFSAASKTLTVEDNAIVSQDYSSDASPTFAGVIIADGGTIGQATGPLLTFNDTSDALSLTGSTKFSIGALYLDTYAVENGLQFTAPAGYGTGLTLKTEDNRKGYLLFADATSGAGTYAGFVSYAHATDLLSIGTASSNRFTIDSSLATFIPSIIAANFEATNKLTACATNAGALDFSAASKTLTVEDISIVSQDYSSDASPTFAGLDLTGITDNTIPYISASGFANSPLGTDGTKVTVGGAISGSTSIVQFSTASSAYPLHIKSTHATSGRGLVIDAGDGAGDFQILLRDKGGNVKSSFQANGSLALGASYAGVNAPDNGTIIQGRAGIGTSSPDTKLQVVGDCKFGDDNTNYISIGTTGDVTFTGSAGFYPRVLNQADEPAAGTGATQCDTGELVVWTDTDDAKCYFCYNHSGTVKTVELT